MGELVRTNDVALIGAVESFLEEAGIPHSVADREMSAIDGGINAIQIRVFVPDDREKEARSLLAESDLAEWLG